MPDDLLRTVPFFADLDGDDLSRISAATIELELSEGDRLFEEGDESHQAYVIVSGELEILKRSSERDVLLAVRGPGDVIGEMSLLEDAPRMAAAKARTDVVLLEIPRSVFDEVLETSHAAARGLFDVLLARWRETEARLRQREQLAQLGTLSAGLAHELNNPAAAARRAVSGFEAATDRLATAHGALDRHEGAAGTAGFIASMVEAETRRLGSLDRGDREDALLARFKALGVEKPASVAATLVDADGAVIDGAIDGLESLGDRALAVAAVHAAAARREVASLTAVAMEATTRISDIVYAVKSYAFTGQAPVQEVDLAKMLDDTLVLMAHKLGDIEIVREYAEVTSFEAHGSELSQVWTNLIDNAADAITSAERQPGRITLRTRTEDGMAVVEVEDDGPGIPDDVLPRVFDSFFTTKPPGSGTGLGLDISYGIVAHRHGGDIDIDTEEGRTTVRVRLPMDGA